MRSMFLEYSFKPRPKSRALGTASSVMTVGLSINGCSPWKEDYSDIFEDYSGHIMDSYVRY